MSDPNKDVCQQIADAHERGAVGESSQAQLTDALGDEPYLIMGCMDLRYCMKQRHPIKEVCRVQKFDLVAFAGCVHMLSNPRAGIVPQDNLAMLYAAGKIIVAHSVRLAMEKHNVRRVLLTTHQGCGHLAWEGYEFSSQEEEENHHREHRLEAARWAHSLFPDLEVMSCFSYLDGELVQIKDLEHVPSARSLVTV